jgi:hypothetical protein
MHMSALVSFNVVRKAPERAPRRPLHRFENPRRHRLPLQEGRVVQMEDAPVQG